MSHTNQTERSKTLVTASFGLLLALLLLFGSRGRDKTVRSLITDMLKPGQELIILSTDYMHSYLQKQLFEQSSTGSQVAHHGTSSEWSQQRLHLERALRAAMLKQAQLQQRLADAQLVPFLGQPGKPLVLPELLDARVLGMQRDSVQSPGVMLDAGLLAGLPESALVIDRPQRLIDQGADAQLHPGQPVYVARSVIGKISHVGRWTSTVQLVTDREYRGRAKTARRTKQGYVFGVDSILEGDGADLCRLKFIPSTEAVRVGDEVFTADSHGMLPLPMYYGRIVKAELKPTAPHWDVWVKPALAEMKLDQVSILRTRYQQDRYLAN